MIVFYHTMADTKNGGHVTIEAHGRHAELRLTVDKGHRGTEDSYSVSVRIPSHQARRLFHALDEIYNLVHDKEDRHG